MCRICAAYVSAYTYFPSILTSTFLDNRTLHLENHALLTRISRICPAYAPRICHTPHMTFAAYAPHMRSAPNCSRHTHGRCARSLRKVSGQGGQYPRDTVATHHSCDETWRDTRATQARWSRHRSCTRSSAARLAQHRSDTPLVRG